VASSRRGEGRQVGQIGLGGVHKGLDSLTGDLDSDGRVFVQLYVGSLDDRIYALNAANGRLPCSYTTGGFVYSSPAVANGVV
jgi:outer membrane protein assembly factor BamB